MFGKGVFGERFDWPGVESVFDMLEQVHDANLTTVSQAEGRADALLRHEAIAGAGVEITVPVNCGQELYDVVEVTDVPGGLSAAKRRVLGIALRYSTGSSPAYEQRIALAGV